MASLPWALLAFSGDKGESAASKFFDGWVKARLAHLEPILASRDWLAGPFSIADIALADTLRLIARFDGLAEFAACQAYVARATARAAFLKAHADQMAHFAAAD
jgi:glutathione S-transferase